MLTKVKTVQRKSSGAKFAIVASEYNAEFVDAMLKAAKAELKRAGAKVEIVRVPGAYEVPVVVAKLARAKTCSAIICLGVILRGQTVHAQHIGDSVSRGERTDERQDQRLRVPVAENGDLHPRHGNRRC